jgi:hypothetical protein
MYFKHLFAISSLVVLGGSSFAITINNELEEKLNSDTLTNIQQTNNELRYKTFNSCDEMDTVMGDLLTKYRHNYQPPIYYSMQRDAVDEVTPISSDKMATTSETV